MNLDLTNKRAVVCGSTQGIGLASAIEIAELGASVTLVARNEEKLQEAVGLLDTSKGQQHRFVVADFTQPEALQEKVAAHIASYGAAHILVNNTGGPPGGPAIGAAIDEFTQAFSNHLICNHLLVQTVVEGMKAAAYGRIINIISTSVKLPLNNLGVSNTIRGAVASWSKTLANELGQFNITVNNVLPGATNTGRLQSIMESKAGKTGQSFDDVKSGFESAVPMKRVAEPNEVANAVAFLASPAASYINGINVPVDGGRTGCL
jgi:3-oxoacyl-[acyl-carrier protein] reductase